MYSSKMGVFYARERNFICSQILKIEPKCQALQKWVKHIPWIKSRSLQIYYYAKCANDIKTHGISLKFFKNWLTGNRIRFYYFFANISVSKI